MRDLFPIFFISLNTARRPARAPDQLISLSFYLPLRETDLKQGGKNSRITAGGGKFLRIFAVKSFRNTLFLVVKTQKHTQKVLKFSPPAVERRKNTLLWFEYTPNRVKYRISAPRRRRKFFEFLPPVEFLPPLVGGRFATRGG